MFIIAIAVLGFITMLLWNALIPDLFHGPQLDYLHAVGLLALARVLVGIRGGRRDWRPWRRWGRRCGRRGWCGSNQQYKYEMNFGGPECREWWQKFAGMSPEERRRVKEEWKSDKGKWKAEFTRHFGKPSEAKPGDEIKT
jgi:hypothetical protein